MEDLQEKIKRRSKQLNVSRIQNIKISEKVVKELESSPAELLAKKQGETESLKKTDEKNGEPPLKATKSVEA